MTYDKAHYGREEVVEDPERGDVRCGHRRVAIIGTGPGREGAPYLEDDWCVWALNEIRQPTFTRHWELHPRRVQSAHDFRALAAIRQPCYVLDPAEWGPGEVPSPARYPLARVQEAGMRRYFSCTFAYQVALAVLEGFEELGLWGVQLHLGSPRERLVERRCVDYWLGYAEGRGLRVSQDSGLAWQPHLYGYDYDGELLDSRAEVRALLQVEAEERAAQRWPRCGPSLGSRRGSG